MGIERGIRQGCWLSPMPVSYTHLDVYKRQVYTTENFLVFSVLMYDGLHNNNNNTQYHP